MKIFRPPFTPLKKLFSKRQKSIPHSLPTNNNAVKNLMIFQENYRKETRDDETKEENCIKYHEHISA